MTFCPFPPIPTPIIVLQNMGKMMSELQITQGCFRLSDTRTLILPELRISSGDMQQTSDSWA
ncbi:hypothetical protein ACNSO7_06165, partial [Yersinia enterocolitica]